MSHPRWLGVCVADGCDLPAVAKNVCNTHYYRLKTHGDPNFVKVKMHGKSGHPLFSTWVSMRQRCRDPHANRSHKYIEKGIRVCLRWDESFENFLEDMESGYKKGLTLDRIDNDGDYEPSNCRWATQKQQANNRDTNHLLTLNGETRTLAEWSEETGIKYTTILQRINNYGWSIERALTTRRRLT